MVKTFSPELLAGDARFDGKFHTETKAGWSPCTGGRNLPISSLNHHSLLNQTKALFPSFAHHIPRAQSGPHRNWAVVFRSKLSGTPGHCSVMLHSWMTSAQKSLRSCAPRGVQRNPVSFWLTKSREPRDPFDIFQPQEGDTERQYKAGEIFSSLSSFSQAIFMILRKKI